MWSRLFGASGDFGDRVRKLLVATLQLLRMPAIYNVTDSGST